MGQILTIDESGRIELPLEIREKLGINKNSRFFLEIKQEQIVLNPILAEAEVINEEGLLVIKTEPIESKNFTKVLDDIREERINQFS